MINPLANVFIKNLNYHVTSKDLVKKYKKEFNFHFFMLFKGKKFFIIWKSTFSSSEL